MFRLTRAYSVASFFGIALVAIALSIFYRTRCEPWKVRSTEASSTR